MGICSPPAGGEFDKRMNHLSRWASRPEHALLDVKVTVGGHRLPTPQWESERFSGNQAVFLLVRKSFPRICGVEPKLEKVLFEG